MDFGFHFFITIALAYILGGVNGAIITSKYLYKQDIREHGSGNPGLTNFQRVFGWRGLLLVVFIDVLKTVAPILIGWWVYAQFGGNGLTGRVVAGLGVILGTCYPVFYKFKGGKTVMAMGTIMFTIDWRVSVICWVTFLLIVALTRYVSLGAVIGCLGYPIAMAAFGIGGWFEFLIAAICAVILIARHRPNIERLLKGTEPKFNIHKKSGDGRNN